MSIVRESKRGQSSSGPMPAARAERSLETAPPPGAGRPVAEAARRLAPTSWWPALDRAGKRALAVSLLLHAIACVVLAFWVWRQVAPLPAFELEAVDEARHFDPIRFETVALEPDLEEAGIAPGLPDAPQFVEHPLRIGANVGLELAPPDAMVGAGVPGGTGTGTSGSGKGRGGLRPVGKNAVREGSFTVWTVPDDPAPGEDYVITIEIRLPDKVTRYPRSDLLGLVTGTDGWRQPLPGAAEPRTPWLAVIDHSVQFEVTVPGAGRKIEDTIRVRSRLLKEERTLKLTF